MSTGVCNYTVNIFGKVIQHFIYGVDEKSLYLFLNLASMNL